MDISYRPYYQLNEFFLSSVGLWPYQSKLKQRIITTIVFIDIISLSVGEFLGLCKSWGNLDTTIDCIPPLLCNWVAIALLVACAINRQKMELLFSKIQKDWTTWSPGPETEILHSYARQGKKFVVIFSIFIYAGTVDFICVPLIPPFLDLLMPLNETRPSVPIVLVEYFINQEDYYFWITLHSIISITVLTEVLVSVDSILIVVLNHACGEMAILGFKLKNLSQIDDENANMDEIKIHQEIKFCIDKHESVLIFVNDICDYLSTAYFLHMGFHMIMISVTGVQAVMHLDQPQVAYTYGMFTLGLLFHLFCLTVPSQSLIDHSLQLSDNIYSGYWYQMSCKSKRKLLMIMMRSTKPCQFTAGKLYTFSMESFATVVRTSMSYFTVLLSVRE